MFRNGDHDRLIERGMKKVITNRIEPMECLPVGKWADRGRAPAALTRTGMYHLPVAGLDQRDLSRADQP
jgi:hypothetical protein